MFDFLTTGFSLLPLPFRIYGSFSALCTFMMAGSVFDIGS